MSTSASRRPDMSSTQQDHKIDRPLWHIVHVFERARSVEAEKASGAPGNVAPVTADTPDMPPTVRQAPSERTFHGDTVTDEFAWLADKENPDTIAYLKAENEWTEAATAHLAGLRDTIFQEIKDRTQETDLSVPSRKGGYWYYTRTVEGKQYGTRCRVAVAPGEVAPPMSDTPPGND